MAYELTSFDILQTAVLAPGNYETRVLAEGPKRADYDLYCEYECYLPTQKIPVFCLSGAGPGNCPAAAESSPHRPGPACTPQSAAANP